MSLLPVDLANGLEFDGAVVVEPAAVVDESPQGLRQALRGADPADAASRGAPRQASSGVICIRGRLSPRGTESGRTGEHFREFPRTEALCSGAGGTPSASKDAVSQALSVDPHAPGANAALRHRPERPPLLAVGVMIWLGSELMFFSGLFAAYFTIRANYPGKQWPPLGNFHLDLVQAGIFSVVLLASSPTFQIGVWAVEQRSSEQRRGSGST